MEFKHYSVLLEETIEHLNIRPDGIYVDGTLGGAGHASEVAKRLSEKGRLIGIDQDADAIRAAGERLKPFGDKVTIIRSNYANMKEELHAIGIEHVDGIVLDLGVSSFQLDTPERGFTYRDADAPLDMRMSREDSVSARDIVNGCSQRELARILYEYGEERRADKIAYQICRAREKAPIETTFQLNDIIKRAFPPSERYGEKHPSKRTYQALRIEVNGELKILEQAIRDAAGLLEPGGRLAVMTFHSLEDRIVKNTLKDMATGCVCNKNIPVCVCGRKATMKLITHKPVTADEKELSENNRSKPAKLRVAEKI